MSYPANINLIEKAITDLQHGKPIIITDDTNRKNEADLIIAVKMIKMPIMAML
ncbi:3,4-dihydroxy-2-butanone-4-phosphate synthase [Snodgrassella alvi]|uniref:3,4-dihydroxy-2-butanone-4-phosphate synthase n=1 Tax=Snodgrassella alvi TaxID=1196083 RepID=UPI000C1E841D|nr:3,4-dihydroxy-2-butanone-4-phosphate synthase [Snodgrassella alvi]